MPGPVSPISDQRAAVAGGGDREQQFVARGSPPAIAWAALTIRLRKACASGARSASTSGAGW